MPEQVNVQIDLDHLAVQVGAIRSVGRYSVWSAVIHSDLCAHPWLAWSPQPVQYWIFKMFVKRDAALLQCLPVLPSQQKPISSRINGLSAQVMEFKNHFVSEDTGHYKSIDIAESQDDGRVGSPPSLLLICLGNLTWHHMRWWECNTDLHSATMAPANAKKHQLQEYSSETHEDDRVVEMEKDGHKWTNAPRNTAAMNRTGKYMKT